MYWIKVSTYVQTYFQTHRHYRIKRYIIWKPWYIATSILQFCSNLSTLSERLWRTCSLRNHLSSRWVHVIKATQNTRLKATTKNTGKKATKIYRNIGYNEYTGLKATAFLNTQEKRLHFLNIQEKRLHSLNIQEQKHVWLFMKSSLLGPITIALIWNSPFLSNLSHKLLPLDSNVRAKLTNHA